MKENNLIVKVKKTQKYNSYQGEITPAPENIIERNFHAERPNEKMLTDITEFSIPAGKICQQVRPDHILGNAVHYMPLPDYP